MRFTHHKDVVSLVIGFFETLPHQIGQPVTEDSVAFALDCCNREAMSFVATTSGITGEDVRDLMVAAVEHSFGWLNRLPVEIEWLTDNGSCYIARETRRFARDVGLVPCTTPLESPQSNGMAEAFVRTLKRDYVRVSPVPDADTVLRQLPSWLAHYNEVHPHRALGYRSPREFIARLTPEGLSGSYDGVWVTGRSGGAA